MLFRLWSLSVHSSFYPLECDISGKTFILKNKEASRPLEWYSGHESVLAHFLVRGMQVNTHMCSYIQKHPPSSCPYLAATLLTPLCPPDLGRCSRRKCRHLRPELSPSPGCCSRRNSETQKSARSAASPPPSVLWALEMSLKDIKHTHVCEADSGLHCDQWTNLSLGRYIYIYIHKNKCGPESGDPVLMSI